MIQKIAFQGRLASYSHAACVSAFPKMTPLPCPTFAAAFKAVETGRAALAMIPIDNAIAGRVADIHHLLPKSKLFIIGEHFIPVHHCLLGVKGAKLSDIKTVYSHVHALPQCRKIIDKLKLKPVVFEDTAGSAQKIAQDGDKTAAAIASGMAAKLYGLKILQKHVEDESGNATRFIVLSKAEKTPPHKRGEKYMTSLLFRVRHMPAALYKALGGFATSGLNIAKLESYLAQGAFHSASFYCEVEGHQNDAAFYHALHELNFYATDIRLLGTYPQHPFRKKS